MEKVIFRTQTKIRNLETINLVLSYHKGNEREESYFDIKASEIAQNEIGYSNFEIDDKTCILLNIQITNDHYHQIGVGGKMLKLVENYAKYTNCTEVKGDYHPYGKGAENTKNFYIKHGYSIIDEGKGLKIYKDLRLKKTEEQTKAQ